jgi:phosphate transport system ATP-binding protein
MIDLVSRNMQQAPQVADVTAFFSVEISHGGRTGYLVEIGQTIQLFETPGENLAKNTSAATLANRGL